MNAAIDLYLGVYSCGFPHHHAAPEAGANDFIALVPANVFKGYDAPVRFCPALPLVDDAGGDRNRVADKDRIGEGGFIETQVAKGRAESGIPDRETNHQAERIDAVNQHLAMNGCFRELPVQMQWLRIMGQRGDQQVVGFRDRSTWLMLKCVANIEFFKVLAWQCLFIPLSDVESILANFRRDMSAVVRVTGTGNSDTLCVSGYRGS